VPTTRRSPPHRRGFRGCGRSFAPAFRVPIPQRRYLASGRRFGRPCDVARNPPITSAARGDREADDHHVRLRRRSHAISAPDEDRSGGFERGGWTTPLWDNESAAFLNQVYEHADAFLFGRRTHEIFAGSWGVMADPGANPIELALNTQPKYVASTTLTDPQWADTTVLSSEVAAAVGELKAKPAGELQVHGSGALIRWLLDNDLVDELNLFIFPVVVGQGTRLFPDTGPDMTLELVESRATPKG
jgi:dihydrofolate reductase